MRNAVHKNTRRRVYRQMAREPVGFGELTRKMAGRGQISDFLCSRRNAYPAFRVDEPGSFIAIGIWWCKK